MNVFIHRFILSAAHCMQGMFASPNLVYAVVGAIKKKDGVPYRLSTIKRHPEYDARKSLNDISILRTTGDITFSHLIQPIALPVHNFAEGEVVISGWGCTSQLHPMEKPKMSETLKFINSSTLSINDCVKQFKGHQNGELVRNTNICTISPVNVGACFGDSGKLRKEHYL